LKSEFESSNREKNAFDAELGIIYPNKASPGKNSMHLFPRLMRKSPRKGREKVTRVRLKAFSLIYFNKLDLEKVSITQE
jgi:hypothetical protein